MPWSDKSVESALNTYNAAISEGVPDWYAMRLALDVAAEEADPSLKKPKCDETTPISRDFFLAMLGALALICGIVVLSVALMAAKG